MATIRKAGPRPKNSGPTYKNLPMGVKNEYYQMTGVSKDIKPTSGDSLRYKGGFEQGLKGMKGSPKEGQVEKMGRWEGQNVGKKTLKKGGSVKKASSMKMKNGGSIKKPLASGVAGKTPKAGMVDPKGAYTKVQTRTLGNMKRGGKMSKKK